MSAYVGSSKDLKDLTDNKKVSPLFPRPPALSDEPNSALEERRFTFPDSLYNMRSPNLGSRSTLGFSASEHNLGHFTGPMGTHGAF